MQNSHASLFTHSKTGTRKLHLINKNEYRVLATVERTLPFLYLRLGYQLVSQFSENCITFALQFSIFAKHFPHTMRLNFNYGVFVGARIRNIVRTRKMNRKLFLFLSLYNWAKYVCGRWLRWMLKIKHFHAFFLGASGKKNSNKGYKIITICWWIFCSRKWDCRFDTRI